MVHLRIKQSLLSQTGESTNCPNCRRPVPKWLVPHLKDRACRCPNCFTYWRRNKQKEVPNHEDKTSMSD